MKLPLARNKFPRGFTLVELLIVISIIGLLSAVFLVGLRTVRSRAKDVQTKSYVKDLSRSLYAYAAEHSERYPLSNGTGSSVEVLIDTPASPGVPASTSITSSVLKNGNYIQNIPLNPNTGDYFSYWSNGVNFYLSGGLIGRFPQQAFYEATLDDSRDHILYSEQPTNLMARGRWLDGTTEAGYYTGYSDKSVLYISEKTINPDGTYKVTFKWDPAYGPNTPYKYRLEYRPYGGDPVWISNGNDIYNKMEDTILSLDASTFSHWDFHIAAFDALGKQLKTYDQNGDGDINYLFPEAPHLTNVNITDNTSKPDTPNPNPNPFFHAPTPYFTAYIKPPQEPNVININMGGWQQKFSSPCSMQGILFEYKQTVETSYTPFFYEPISTSSLCANGFPKEIKLMVPAGTYTVKASIRMQSHSNPTPMYFAPYGSGGTPGPLTESTEIVVTGSTGTDVTKPFWLKDDYKDIAIDDKWVGTWKDALDNVQVNKYYVKLYAPAHFPTLPGCSGDPFSTEQTTRNAVFDFSKLGHDKMSCYNYISLQVKAEDLSGNISNEGIATDTNKPYGYYPSLPYPCNGVSLATEKYSICKIIMP